MVGWGIWPLSLYSLSGETKPSRLCHASGGEGTWSGREGMGGISHRCRQEGGTLSVENLKAIIKPIKSLFAFYSHYAPEILKSADNKMLFPTEEGCSPLPSGGSRNKSRTPPRNNSNNCIIYRPACARHLVRCGRILPLTPHGSPLGQA